LPVEDPWQLISKLGRGCAFITATSSHRTRVSARSSGKIVYLSYIDFRNDHCHLIPMGFDLYPGGFILSSLGAVSNGEGFSRIRYSFFKRTRVNGGVAKRAPLHNPVRELIS
jgi:hypothetical protein